MQRVPKKLGYRICVARSRPFITSAQVKNESPLQSSIFIELSMIGLELFDLMRLLLRLGNVDVCLLVAGRMNDIKTVLNQYFDLGEPLFMVWGAIVFLTKSTGARGINSKDYAEQVLTVSVFLGDT